MKTKKYIDLHTHTHYSDGLFLQPKDLVAAAAINGINLLAVTDHDSFEGYEEAKKEAEKWTDFQLIPGVEITTPNYHLLALNFNPEDRQFRQFIDYSREQQRLACEMRVKILREGGVPLKFSDVKKQFPNSRLGKFNIFYTMMTNPECKVYFDENHPGKSVREIQKYYFGKGGIASDMEDRASVSVEEAIFQTKRARGVIGIAHPAKDVKDTSELERLLKLGIEFVESQPNMKEEYPKTQMFEDYAIKRKIPVSYGSDYHGVTMPSRQILRQRENVLSDEMLELLNKRGYVKVYGDD